MESVLQESFAFSGLEKAFPSERIVTVPTRLVVNQLER
jgi:hypothetical protein